MLAIKVLPLLLLLVTLFPVDVTADLSCTLSLFRQPWHAILAFLLDIVGCIALIAILVRMIKARRQVHEHFVVWMVPLIEAEQDRHQ